MTEPSRSLRLVVATRKSQLALAQTRAWISALAAAHPGLEVSELHVTTTGDRVQDRPLNAIGGKGLFIKEIEEALLSGEADVAVHSLKDVPAELPEGLELTCIPRREDPRDALVTRGDVPPESLPRGARLGTSSLRRGVQLRARYPHLEVVPLRGNVDTRLRKCREGEVDVAVLALAGLKRLGLQEVVTQVLEPEHCLPAIGQGALAIEARRADSHVHELLRPLHHDETATAVAAERGLMVAVEGSCQIPVAGHATRQGDELWLRGMLAEEDGSDARFDAGRLAWPDTVEGAEALGRELGARLKSGR